MAGSVLKAGLSLVSVAAPDTVVVSVVTDAFATGDKSLVTCRSDAGSVGPRVWLVVSTAVVCATLTSVTAALVVNSVSPDWVVVDSFTSIRSGVEGSAARGLLVVTFDGPTSLLGTIVD